MENYNLKNILWYADKYLNLIKFIVFKLSNIENECLIISLLLLIKKSKFKKYIYFNQSNFVNPEYLELTIF